MTILWQPSADQIAATRLTAFSEFAARKYSAPGGGYAALHAWSIDNREAFWSAIWEFCGVVASEPGKRILVDGDRMPGARFFPDARLNFAENLLRRRDDADALVFRSENGYSSRLSHRELYDEVSRVSQALRDTGVAAGDRIAAMMPNIPETIVCSLASASIGALWSSCSPDFGVKGVLDRFQQIEPKLLIACDGYMYNGKEITILDKVREIAAALPSLERVIIVPYLARLRGSQAAAGPVADSVLLDDFKGAFSPGEIPFEQLPFSHPLYIMFTSGTTGLPKCIVHGHGGTLLQHLKEHQFHFDVKRDDRVFWFTTCGWMMWNWLVTALASEATLLLFDGSPVHPDPAALFDFASQERMTQMGVSAKFIQSIEKTGLRPIATHNLDALRVIGSTGSTLLPEGFDYIYRDVKKDVCLSSASGGTDIISCFVGGNPNAPVHRGEIQCKGLGMAVEVWDDSGTRVVGQKGELVCTRAFPSMPVGFWNDPDNSRYHNAYFEKYPGIWAHGDFAEETVHGGFFIYGRSDATLNPGGVRIGTAEIYRQVEQFQEILESVAIGQEWDGDIRIVLFVVLRDGMELNDDLVSRLRAQIRSGASPRHVPARIVAVPEIPRTRSGKITELAIREVVHGRHVKNIEALANPQALDHFQDRPELSS